MYKTFHVSRAQRNTWAADNPIGDPFGGPAYGEKTDIGGVIGSVAGGLFGGNAADSAADAQTQAANTASKTQLEMFNKGREDQAPWRDRGNAAGNRLQFLLGLPSASGGQYSQTAEQIRNELLPAFTSTGQAGGTSAPNLQYGGPFPNGVSGGYDGPLVAHYDPLGGIAFRPGSTSTVNEAGLSAAIQKRMDEQRAQAQTQQNADQNDPAYGSLLRNFTMADRDADPVYQSGLQFGLDEGRKGIDRAFAAKGGMLSGAAAKAMARFGSDYNSTKANESYNRFNNNKSQTYNMLSGVSGTGQISSNQIANQGISTGNQIAQNTMGAGQARASGYINQNNALQDAIGGVYGAAKRGGLFGNTGSSSGGTVYNNDGSTNYDASGFWDLNSWNKG